MRQVAWPTVLALAALVGLLLFFASLGRAFGRPPAIPWVCDDTRYVDTVPIGRAVVGPAVAAPPGCG